MPELIAILTFAAVALGVFVAAQVLDQSHAQARLIRERIADAKDSGGLPPIQDLAFLRDQMLSRIPAFDTLLRRSDRVSQLQKMLEQGGLQTRAGNFLLLSVASCILVAILILLFNQPLVFSLSGGVVGFFLPHVYATQRRAKRFQLFEERFPEAIDTLARAVRAGHAFTTALELIATEVAEPVASEFRKLYEEQKFGLPVREALLNLADRVPLVDVKFFVTAVMLQRETGGNFAEILDNLSYLIRERFKIQRQVRVYTAQGRMTMALLMGLPPVVVVSMLIFNPSFIRPLFTDPIGHTLIVIGITLQTIGYFVIRKITRIQV